LNFLRKENYIFFMFYVFFIFFRTKLHTCMYKPVRSELNWPMYSTHAIIIAKEREMKNLPVQEATSKIMTCFGSLGFSSLLKFFSSFNFLGLPVLTCIFLSTSVFVLLHSAPLCCSSCFVIWFSLFIRWFSQFSSVPPC